MKNLLIIILVFGFIFSLTFNLLAQDKRYTRGAENGFVWITLAQPGNILTDYKNDYLASMLENQRLKKLVQKKQTSPIDCENDVRYLSESDKSNQLDLGVMVKMNDGFYSNEENLIIPIMGAYCYSIKALAGTDKVDLETYRQKLLIFSKQ